jgi:hypothetical protein
VAVTRGNLAVFLTLTSLSFLPQLWLQGLLPVSTLWLGIVLLVPYGIGTGLGTLLFRPGWAWFYRRFAYAADRSGGAGGPADLGLRRRRGMRITEVEFGTGTPIDGYGPGFFRVGGTVQTGAVLVLPGRVGLGGMPGCSPFSTSRRRSTSSSSAPGPRSRIRPGRVPQGCGSRGRRGRAHGQPAGLPDLQRAVVRGAARGRCAVAGLIALPRAGAMV